MFSDELGSVRRENLGLTFLLKSDPLTGMKATRLLAFIAMS